MSNIYLKVNIEENWRSQSVDFSGLKNMSAGKLWGYNKGLILLLSYFVLDCDFDYVISSILNLH